MQLPNVVHPTVFVINGHRVQVVAYCTLSQTQARAAALHAAARTKLPKKANPKKVIQLLTTFDSDTAQLLGP
jgi:hypothetical protein